MKESYYIYAKVCEIYINKSEALEMMISYVIVKIKFQYFSDRCCTQL